MFRLTLSSTIFLKIRNGEATRAARTQTKIMKYLKQNLGVGIVSSSAYLAFLCVTLVLSGQMTARNLSKEMADRVSTLDTMQSTGN